MRSLTALEVQDRVVFVRTEFNVALSEDHRILEDSRLRASLPTIEWLVEQGAKTVICSHLGRPWGERDPDKSMRHLVDPLAELLDHPVQFAADCVGTEREARQGALSRGDVLLLENVRYYQEENQNDDAFARRLAAGVDAYVNDAFGTSHRAHASMVGVPALVRDKAMGLLLEAETRAIESFLVDPPRPALAIVGGAKVTGKDGKIHVIRNLLRSVDAVCIVGKIAYYFLQATGRSVGETITGDTRGIDAPTADLEESFTVCREALEEAEAAGKEVVLPIDSEVLDRESDRVRVVEHDGSFPARGAALDLGPRSRARVRELVESAESVVWNGPAGFIEDPRFLAGTRAIAEAIREAKPRALIGGGDTLTALGDDAPSAGDRIHISTGGGAMLTMLMGRPLPAIEALR